MYCKIVDLVVETLYEAMYQLNSSTAVVLSMDNNDGFGIPMSDADLQMRCVGPLHPKQEHYCSAQLRHLAYDFSLVVANTYVGGQDTYFGTKNETHQI